MTKILTFVGLVIAVLVWGVSFISIDIALEDLSVNEINIIRFTISTAILWLIQLIRGKKIVIRGKDFWIASVAGIFGTAGYYYFENTGLLHISPGMVSVVTGAIPITTLVIAMLFFKKKTKFRNIFLIFLSFTGILVLMNPFSAEGQTNMLGVGLVMLANIFWSLYTLMNERLNKTYDKLQLLTIHFTAGLIAFYGFYFYDLSVNVQNRFLDVQKLIANANLMGHVIFIAIFASIVAYFLYNYAVDHLGVMISALFINVIPVITLIVSTMMGVEVLSFNKVMGCIMVVIAIFFIEDI